MLKVYKRYINVYIIYVVIR